MLPLAESLFSEQRQQRGQGLALCVDGVILDFAATLVADVLWVQPRMLCLPTAKIEVYTQRHK